MYTFLKIVGYLLYFRVLIPKLYSHFLKKTNMKNSFKIAFLALAIATSFAACKGSGSGDADTTAKDTTAKM